MKKYFYSLFLLFTFLLVFVNVPAANAQVEDNKEIIYQAQEITDIDELLERALNGVHEVELNNIELPKYQLTNSNKIKSSTLTNSELSEDFNVTNVSTSQLLKVEKIGDVEIEEFAITTFGLVEETDNINGFNIASAESGNKGEEKWDSSYSVKAYSTIYYSRKKENNIEYAKITKATGGWKISDSTVSITSRKVSVGTSGFPSLTQAKDYSPTSNEWSYSSDFKDWKYVSLQYTHYVGATSTATLKSRGGSVWTLQLQNNI